VLDHSTPAILHTLILAQCDENFKAIRKHLARIMHKFKTFADSYRVNLVDEHAEVSHVRVVPTKVGVALFHATVVCLLNFLRGCIWHLMVEESGVPY
jgi:hypothetical protein